MAPLFLPAAEFCAAFSKKRHELEVAFQYDVTTAIIVGHVIGGVVHMRKGFSR